MKNGNNNGATEQNRGTITQLTCEMHIRFEQRCDSFQTDVAQYLSQCCYLGMNGQQICSTTFQCKINVANGGVTKVNIKEHQK